jgi:hypothetical protein
VIIVGGSDKLVVAYVHKLPQLFYVGVKRVHILFGLHSLFRSAARNVLSVLVGAGKEKHVPALHALEARYGVAYHGCVAMPQMQLAGRVIKRRRDIKCFFLFHF